MSTHINRKVPWVLRRPDFEAILQGVYEAVQSRPGAFRQYGCVLVDERSGSRPPDRSKCSWPLRIT